MYLYFQWWYSFSTYAYTQRKMLYYDLINNKDGLSRIIQHYYDRCFNKDAINNKRYWMGVLNKTNKKLVVFGVVQEKKKA